MPETKAEGVFRGYMYSDLNVKIPTKGRPSCKFTLSHIDSKLNVLRITFRAMGRVALGMEDLKIKKGDLILVNYRLQQVADIGLEFCAQSVSRVQRAFRWETDTPKIAPEPNDNDYEDSLPF